MTNADKPWLSEPRSLQFVSSGLACFLLRHGDLGHLCGYVAVPAGHPVYGQDVADLRSLKVHGGIISAYPRQKIDWRAAGWTRPPSMGGLPTSAWVLAFDGGHAGDLMPNIRGGSAAGSVYRDWGFMRREAEKLAEQLSGMGSKPSNKRKAVACHLTVEVKGMLDEIARKEQRSHRVVFDNVIRHYFNEVLKKD